jgi:F0F1-type ATP synthase assembly protein I
MPVTLFPPSDGPDPEEDRREEPDAPDEPVFYLPYTPESVDETIRKSSLAWSLGGAFVISVGVFLFLGWLADLFLGSSPWGLVGGIVLGALLGFFQFFRISSQIFPARKDGPAVRPLMSNHDDESS